MQTTTDFNPQPITLNARDITLKPLVRNDFEGFYLAGNHERLWRWVVPNPCETHESTRAWIDKALRGLQLGDQIPFVIIDNLSQKIIGSTRYCSIRRDDRNIEIGHTFIIPDFQRTHVNTQAKFLLLKHAFEVLGAIRVEIKTHEKNQQSRSAILRIGAKFEGVLRNNRILPDGNVRSTAIFSITEQEWLKVKSELQVKMERVVGAVNAHT
ncbi:GNAT family N-acetyltransferase [Shewanella sp. D64]|uniref:GNAT family N-acetyltransferase n=1 Tax=unclassified Shewanella TaxID=196818 RepID=UPI0022BA2B79|nr:MULTISPECIES: GNAT family protein [unclassified Shewanella]MEC4728436.1 GNAT family N-acetyltransferase [Shewanella sp. D64]MEC4740466.1 GNAT family N-acetyltransferase [Shewanella sp. E94]WBJ94026.1 GNAT family N-acetyltransferase [Shewanella sp. MTB7]